MLDDLLHIALQVVGEGLLVREPGLDQSVVEDDVDAGLAGLICTLVGLFGRGVGAIEDNFALLPGLVLRNKQTISHLMTFDTHKELHHDI